MALQGGLTFQFADGRVAEHVRFAVGDAAQEAALRHFLTEALALQDALQRQGGFASSYHFSWSVENGVQISGSEPSDDQRAVVLHRLRPILLEEESCYFHSVRGIVARSTESPFLHEWLRQTKARFMGKLIEQKVVISVGDLVLNSERALNHWLYGFEYHRDEAKSVALIKAHDPVPVDSSRPIFIMMLREKAVAVLHLAHVVHKMLQEPTHIVAPDA
jgi:hypothetical protein